MGQYHFPVNLTKREYIVPHELGTGLKQLEQLWTQIGSVQALFILLCSSNNRGGGDIRAEDSEYYHHKDNPQGIIGRWAGDRIAVIGDYSEDDDIPGDDGVGGIFAACDEPGSGWRNVSEDLIPIMEREFDVKIDRTHGWREWIPNKEE